MSYEYNDYRNAERRRAESVYWAGVFMWAGLVFGYDILFALPQIGTASALTWFVVGAGLYGLLINAYYAASPETINPRPNDWLWSGFWLVIGLSGFFTAGIFWPMVSLIVGSIALAGALRRR